MKTPQDKQKATQIAKTMAKACNRPFCLVIWKGNYTWLAKDQIGLAEKVVQTFDPPDRSLK